MDRAPSIKRVGSDSSEPIAVGCELPNACALGLAHALAEIRDGASGKAAQFRCLCFGLVMLRVPGHEIIQPEAQLGAIFGRKLCDGLLDFFQGHQCRIAVHFRDLNPDGLPIHRPRTSCEFQGTGCPFYLAPSFLLCALCKAQVASAFPAVHKPSLGRIRPESRRVQARSEQSLLWLLFSRRVRLL